jgi:glycosyltransferase 2 family protein
MGKKILSSLQYVFFIGIGAFLIWWQLSSMTDEQFSEFKNALKNANYILILPVVIISILSHVSRSMRWKIMMEPIGYEPKLKNVFAVTMIGYLANSFVPRIGEIVKCTLLAKYENLKTDKLIGTIIVERTFDLLTYFLFLLLTVLIQIDVIGNYVSGKLKIFMDASSSTFFIKIVVAILVCVAVFYGIKRISRLYPNNKFLLKINAFLAGVVNGFTSIKKLKRRRAFILHTIFIWSMYLLQIYIGFKAMEATSHLGIKAACSVLSLSTLAMIVTPGGMGSFPIFVMETLIIYGIVNTAGYAFGWLIWGVSTILIIIVGAICFIGLLSTNKIKNESFTSNRT